MILAVVLPCLVRVLGALYFVFDLGLFLELSQIIYEFKRNTMLILANRTGKLIVPGVDIFFKARIAYSFIAV